VPGGYVEWVMGSGDADSVAASIAPPEHWALVDLVAIVQAGPKSIGSTEGHALAGESPFQAARVHDAPRRLAICRRAIMERDFSSLAEIVEQDSNLMHAVMMTAVTPLFYWEPASLRLMKLIPGWRREGLPACYTLDAGPNVHVLCPADSAGEVLRRLERVPGVRSILRAGPGGAAHCVSEEGV
jgi:diphosphomevalonate decarboxylase